MWGFILSLVYCSSQLWTLNLHIVYVTSALESVDLNMGRSSLAGARHFSLLCLRQLQQLQSRAQWLKTVNCSITTLSRLVTSCQCIHQECACITKTQINPLVRQVLGLLTAFPQPHLQAWDTPGVKVGSQSRLLVLQLGAHPGLPIFVMCG